MILRQFLHADPVAASYLFGCGGKCDRQPSSILSAILAPYSAHGRRNRDAHSSTS